MSKRIRVIALLLMAALLGGCGMKTPDEMYCLPKRSDNYHNVQTAIDSAMEGLSYCAPLAGENQQPVQIADLNDDGVDEYLLFAKSGDEKPLRILVFQSVDGAYVHTDTVQSNGTAFDTVEYVQMDDRPGLEIVVGCQLSDQVIRSAFVYTWKGNKLEQLINLSYTKILTVDLDNNGISELMQIHPGNAETDNGVVSIYSIHKGIVERSNEVTMSQPADKLKRIMTGKLHGGTSAVFVASTVDDAALITDVFTIRENMLANVSLSNESGTSIKTLRNYYIYADDIDNDGILELPALVNMKQEGSAESAERQHMIRWYALTPSGEEIDKLYTFHNFIGGWYLQLNDKIVPQLTVTATGFQYEFSLWDEEYKTTEKLLTIYAITGQNKEEQAVIDGRFVVYRTETTVYAAKLEPIASEYELTQDSVIYSFRLIQLDWKTGET